MKAIHRNPRIVIGLSIILGCYLFIVTRRVRERDTDYYVPPRLRSGLRFALPTPIPNSDKAQVYPGGVFTHDSVVGKQVQAFHEWNVYECQKEVPDHVFELLRDTIARDFSHNYSTMLDVLRRQLSAYEEMANLTTPTGIAGSHCVALKALAVRKNPSNYTTQLFVLNEFIEDYLRYRGSGNNGESILRYLLRFESVNDGLEMRG